LFRPSISTLQLRVPQYYSDILAVQPDLLPAAMSNVHLSVIIPAYNEERRLPGTLRHVVDYLSARSYGSEVIVVDDGSSDGTAQAIRHFESPIPVHLHVHSDGANHGKGASVKRGMLEATGDYRLFMDADNSTTVDQIEGFWPRIEGGCDVAIGSRVIAGAHVATHQPWYRELAGRSGNWVIRTFAVPGIVDTQVGFKMFTRRSAETVFPRLTIDRWGFDVEVLAIARLHGFRVCELPVQWNNSPGSKVGMNAYVEVLAEVLRIRRNLKSGIYR
jgi:dolichyl-phosphate beta-glucosyltransferase